MMSKNLMKVVMAALLLCAGHGTVLAGTVVYEDIWFMSSQGGQPQPGSFTVSGTGTYQVKLKDFTYPESFKALGLWITGDSPDGYEVARLNAPGELVFDIGPGTYYASLFGQTGDVLGIGLYGVQITQFELPAPVPLPPALWLLGSVLASLAAFYRRRPELDVAMA
jgi:hypothetical protein